MIEIHVTSYNGRSPPLELKAEFGRNGGTIGRGAENRLVLPDPARHVSRLQAQVRCDGSGFRIANVSAGNPLFLNEREIASGDEQPLAPGDELRVGLYVLGVRESSQSEPAVPMADDAFRSQETVRPAPIATGSLPLSLRSTAGAAPDPFADLLGGSTDASALAAGRAAAADPFADLMQGAARPGGTTPPAVAVAAPAPPPPAAAPPSPPPAAAPAARIIPEDFDPFILPGAAQRTASAPARHAPLDLVADGPAAAPERPEPSPAPAPAASPLADEPLAAIPPQPVAAGAAAAPPTDHDALLAAFLRGARVAGTSLPTQLTPQLMESLGTLVYHATAGAMELAAARQITKREMRSDVTMIVPRGNNPLKFLPTPEAAIIQMLGPNLPGFIGSARAMEEVFEDLRAHEVGVIAGMRAAMTETLRQFDPARLEESVPKPRFPQSLFPARRAAALWQAFATRYREVWQRAQDDTQTQFGEAFIAAYEEEVERDRAQRGRQ